MGNVAALRNVKGDDRRMVRSRIRLDVKRELTQVVVRIKPNLQPVI